MHVSSGCANAVRTKGCMCHRALCDAGVVEVPLLPQARQADDAQAKVDPAGSAQASSPAVTGIKAGKAGKVDGVPAAAAVTTHVIAVATRKPCMFDPCATVPEMLQVRQNTFHVYSLTLHIYIYIYIYICYTHLRQGMLYGYHVYALDSKLARRLY